jgi:hypothetical protein
MSIAACALLLPGIVAPMKAGTRGYDPRNYTKAHEIKRESADYADYAENGCSIRSPGIKQGFVDEIAGLISSMTWT